jgi:thiol-disulfide isomerase/thioredoxin
MSHLFRILLFGLISLFLPFPAPATELGDPAPPLEIKQWIKGGPVDLEAGKGESIFVVEFWATWCLPCRETIPRLTQLQKKYKNHGVTIIGISDEDQKKVRKFVKAKGKTMDYVVAVDRNKKTKERYLAEFGIDSIPHAFVIDRSGRIAWSGNPLKGLGQVLDLVVSGRYDLEANVRTAKAKKLIPVYFYLATKTGEHDLSERIGERIADLIKDNAPFLNRFAWVIASGKKKHRDLNLAGRLIRRAYEITKGKDHSILDTYARIMFERGEVLQAVDLQQRALALKKDEKGYKARLEKYQEHLKSGATVPQGS